MPEKQCNLADERQTRLAQIQKHLEELTPDELQTEFETFFLNAADDPLDLELLDLYLKQLNQCSPMEPELTAEESLNSFRDKHALLLKSLESEPVPPKRRRAVRVVVMAAAAVLLMGMMIIQVSGVDWIGSFARWSSELFGLSTRDYEVVTQWNPEYDGLRAAVEEMGFTERIVPKYLPEGYQETELRIDPVEKSIVAMYSYEDNSMMFTANLMLRPEGMSIEKSIKDPEIYVAGNIEHYMMTNMDASSFTAVWENGDFDCAIYGVPNKDDLIKMIDSIYTEIDNEA